MHRIKHNNVNDKDLVIVGVLGCMAELLKEKLFVDKKDLVDLVAGQDAYRDLPRLISIAWDKKQSLASLKKQGKKNKNSKKDYIINTKLQMKETYDDITPFPKDDYKNSTSAFVTIMRGCNNMCSFCIVPFTRGRERSRDFHSILKESEYLIQEKNVKEIVLLGQNVNSSLL